MRITRPLLRWLHVGLLPWLCLGLALPCAVRAQEVTEYSMKAVLFYRLSQFIYWPEGEKAPNPLILCLVGKNPFGNRIEQLSQSSPGTEVRIGPSDPNACHLLFISRSEAGNLDAWLSRTENRRVVTVSDIPGFARAGGVIELPLEGERVGIVINRRSAQKKGIEFNAQLLRLARTIDP